MAHDLGHQHWEERLPGLTALHVLTRGDPSVVVAFLDGPSVRDRDAGEAREDATLAHGTYVDSLIFGSIDGLIEGLAPRSGRLALQIYSGDTAICSHADLAAAIHDALRRGAAIINISASEQIDPLAVSNELSDALQAAQAADVLVVAAVGNQGCGCDSIPASISGVLAVGAHGDDGRPLASSNWGLSQRGGLLAPGFRLPVGCVEGGICHASGTSFAAAIVSAVAALFMALDAENGRAPSAARIRRLLVDSADPCAREAGEPCAKFLSGRLNVARAVQSYIQQDEGNLMDTELEAEVEPAGSTYETGADFIPPAAMPVSAGIAPAHGDGDCGCGGGKEGGCSCGGKSPGGCSCGGKGGAPQLVYAIGRLGVSFPTQSRRDAIWRKINMVTVPDTSPELDLKPLTNAELRNLITDEPWYAQSVVWVLSRTEVPMYAIVPAGPFADQTYKWLASEWADLDVEFMSLAGTVVGQVTLYDGTVVDAVMPDMRGLYSWNQRRYVDAITAYFGKVTKKAGDQGPTPEQLVDRFLRKIYYRIRNRGRSPEERALNAAATNAFNLSGIIVDAGTEGLAFKDISVEKSPFSRRGAEYYDVLLTFFSPQHLDSRAPLVARFTIDVSDTVPVLIGEPVTWYEY